MLKRKSFKGVAIAVAMVAAGLGANGAETPAAAAMAQLAKDGKTSFVVIYKGQADTAKTMRQEVDKAVAELKGQAGVVTLDVDSQADSDVVARFNATKAPMPLTLSVAPNGAVTGGFPEQVTAKALVDSVVGKQEAALVKVMQEGKVAVVSVQNAKSQGADVASKAVTAFVADKRISGFAEAIAVDPADTGAKDFLSRLKLDAGAKEAVTLLVVPPGRIAGKYVGAVDANQMFADLTKAIAGSGCGPQRGGCGPKGGCN